MSNGRAERMVASINKSITETVLQENMPWSSAVVYGYRRKRKYNEASPFQLMYGVIPRMTNDEYYSLIGNLTSLVRRKLELIAAASMRAKRSDHQQQIISRRQKQGHLKFNMSKLERLKQNGMALAK